MIVTSGVAGAAVGPIELTGGADLQRRYAIDRADFQEVVDGAAAFALQQIPQVDPVAFAGLEILDHVGASVAGLPDKGIAAQAADQGVIALAADQCVVTRATEQDVIALATVERVVAALAEK
nr:hypothetical protein GCM10020185_29940 [Pseudomonas brassicacearum subsp. brassicacearum]